MGMAASQARYLALVARKSNCEYEGQQINQARTALANQSANLFNQMLGLQVPIPPSTQDFTKTQYSFKDGINAATISDWYQLAGDQEYNYVVTHYYYTDKYTGSVKELNDPQVQTSGIGATSVTNSQIQQALLDIEDAKEKYEAKKAARIQAEADVKDLSKYKFDQAILSASFANNEYTVNLNPSGTQTYKAYSALSPTEQTSIDGILNTLITQGALSGAPSDYHDKIYCLAGTQFAFVDDLNGLNGMGSSTGTTLPYYHVSATPTNAGALNSALSSAKIDEGMALLAYNSAQMAYNNLNVPTYIGNSELTALSELNQDQLAEINQVIDDMRLQNIDTELDNCFDGNGNYLGGIFKFTLNGTTYYTTLEDLKNSHSSGTGNNNIDGQQRLNYYNATYVSTKVEETEKALLETDSYGRFTSIRFENDSIKYKLSMETITDEAAYDDAMNQFYYENAKYDKLVQDINARTSIIHQQDRQLELRLKQLDTEQSALSTEMDAVKKVVDDNVEKSFKTFGG
ncbi:hypothetical protein IKB17_04690 [bacterium]|nr:hypothetical protein [bacterium]